LGNLFSMAQTPFRLNGSVKSSEWIERDNVIRLNLGQCFNPNCLVSNPGNLDICQRCGSALQLAGRYRAVHTIGSGGFASTFKAVDEHRLNTPCVIKQFLPQQQDDPTYQKAVDLFRQEAVLLRDLGHHPQIPDLMAFLEQDGRLYIVQEYIQGLNLLQTFRQRGRFDEVDIDQMLKSLLPVLQFIHDHQVIHRDIKPSNIVYKSDGTLVLIDFGSSHQSYTQLFDRRTPRTATPGYASPEQMQGQVYPASDLFSLGLTCFRLLTGCFPDDQGIDPLFDETEQQWCWQNYAESLSPKFRVVFERLLQTDVKHRYESAQEVLEDLATSQCILPGNLSHPSLQPHAEPNYTYLESLLAAQRYQDADQETWRLLLEMAHRTQEGDLNLAAIETLSSLALSTLDDLWVTYSQGRFGLRVQQQQYQSFGGTADFDFALWHAFAKQVGWCRDRQWLNYAELTFDSAAPLGHLPTCCMNVLNRQGSELGVCGWWRLGFVALMERL
jgi:serine/threonine protein kinase